VPHSAEISVKVDSDVIADLLRRELASLKPDQEKIARLRSTLEEVRAANQEALRLFANWDADAFAEVYFKPFS
jgi:hypothetical protein